jgi:hypothetical protein
MKWNVSFILNRQKRFVTKQIRYVNMIALVFVGILFNLTANVFGLGEVCEALACVVGQIAPSPCYTLARLIKR